MSRLETTRARIKSDIGATGRRALVVEGTDDMAALRIWLNHRDPTWESHWVLAEAGGKAHVIALAKVESAWVQQTLHHWAEVLMPATVFANFQAELSRVQTLSADDFLRTTVYAKKFYPMVVHPMLNKLLGQASENNRLRHLFQHMLVPTDLEPLWKVMGV